MKACSLPVLVTVMITGLPFAGVTGNPLDSSAAWSQEAGWPETVAEQSQFRATSRSDQVIAYLDELVQRAPHIRRVDFGSTPEGRPLVAAVVAQPPVDDPQKLADDPRLVVLLLGNIHAGECAGKEALLILLRELARQPDPTWLSRLVLVFVPNYNADGNDRMRPDNRPGQVGPAEGMGQRANAQGLDLNRDFIKLDAPETRQLVALINRWDPHLLIDTHTTNGSRHRYQLTYDVPHNPASPAALREFLRQDMMPAVTRRLESREIATFYYGNFDRDHRRWTTYGDEPRYSTEYLGLRGRLAILAEAYAYIGYRERIVAVQEFVRACLDYCATRQLDIQVLLAEVRDRCRAAGSWSGAENRVPLRSQLRALDERIVVRGYERTVREGDSPTEQWQARDYEVEFQTLFAPTLDVARPYAYVLSPADSSIVERLRGHGIQLHRLNAETLQEVETYRIDSIERAGRTYQGHRLTRVAVTRQAEQRRLSPGDLIVMTSQPLGTLAVYLLEPQAADGFVTWNLFEPELAPDRGYPVLRIPVPVTLPLDVGDRPHAHPPGR
jgi:hypothetical protein